MSTVKTNNAQIGQSVTATNNMTWYQPSTPDGTVRLGVGNAGATTNDILIATSTGVAFNLPIQTVQTSNFAATAGYTYPVNTTSGAVTVTLPASPTAGNQITVFDYAGTAATYSISINPNGGKINGVAGSAFISTTRASVTLAYVDSTQGWVDVAVGNAAYIPQTYSVSYLVVAGGGGGSWNIAGGGGAGGLLSSSATFYIGSTYSITVGSGGTGSNSANGTNGNNSILGSIATSIGGGTGGSLNSNGISGGSGGGGATNYGQNTTGGAGTSGQGYAGGAGSTTYLTSGGGGGGAGAIGAAGSSVGGAGGVGYASSITGSSVYYAGGGGGGSYSGTAGAGGTGGGGAGGYNYNATAGSTNTGGGGGGGGNPNTAGANGGSGVVILSVPTANYSGTTTGSPTVTTSGSNTILKFTSSGSYTA